MTWKKISIVTMPQMTDEQQIFHLNLNPHGNWGAEPQDWASMTRAKRTLMHRRMHRQNRERAMSDRTIRLLPHDHGNNEY